MNIILLLMLFVGNNGNDIDSCKIKYTEFILNKGIGEHSYYLNVWLKDNKNKKINVVVTNYELYGILKEEQNINKSEYINIVKKSILSGEPIILSKPVDEYGKYIFLFCRKDKKVEEVAKQGRDYFIKYFFEQDNSSDPVQKETINLAAVIKQLIMWQVPVKLGDNEGGFFADTSAFKCDHK